MLALKALDYWMCKRQRSVTNDKYSTTINFIINTLKSHIHLDFSGLRILTERAERTHCPEVKDSMFQTPFMNWNTALVCFGTYVGVKQEDSPLTLRWCNNKTNKRNVREGHRAKQDQRIRWCKREKEKLWNDARLADFWCGRKKKMAAELCENVGGRDGKEKWPFAGLLQGSLPGEMSHETGGTVCTRALYRSSGST